MRNWLILIAAFALAYSCQDNPTKNITGELTVDESIEEQAAVGYQINQYVNTADEIEMMTSGLDNQDVSTGFGQMNSQAQSSNQAIARFNRVKSYLKSAQTLQKSQGEIPLYYIDSVNENGDKYRSAVYADLTNGTMRFYYVIYEFAARNVNGHNLNVNMIYDSTEIKFTFTGQDFENLTPSEIIAYQNFKPDYLVDFIATKMTVSDFNNDIITAFTSKTNTVYNSGKLDSSVVLVNYQLNGISTVTETFYFNDGTSYSNSITFNMDGTGSFTRTTRRGVTISGSFNQVQDDGIGAYNATWTFPQGEYIDTILKQAEVNADSSLGTVYANYFERINFSNGDVDSSRIIINSDFSGTTTYNITRRNGAHGVLTMESNDDLSLLSGYWITYDSLYIDVRAEYYGDGSAYLYYAVYENQAAFENGADPVFIAEYNFAADGSGNGVVRSGDNEYQIELDDSGKAELVKDGARKTISMYRNN